MSPVAAVRSGHVKEQAAARPLPVAEAHLIAEVLKGFGVARAQVIAGRLLLNQQAIRECPIPGEEPPRGRTLCGAVKVIRQLPVAFPHRRFDSGQWFSRD